MIISILQYNETSKNICLTPEAVSVLTHNNHSVLVEGDADKPYTKKYLNVGAYSINTKEELLDRADLIVKQTSLMESEVAYIEGNDKIFFSTIDFSNKTIIKKLINCKITFFDFAQLEDFKKDLLGVKKAVGFSNFVLPFLISIADNGPKALVENEDLRSALLLMRGKVYNNELALLYKLPCYEF